MTSEVKNLKRFYSPLHPFLFWITCHAGNQSSCHEEIPGMSWKHSWNRCFAVEFITILGIKNLSSSLKPGTYFK
jgi:hypothetical protein